MLTSKRPEISLKMKYGLAIRSALVISLLLLIGVFLFIPRVESRVQRVEKIIKPIEDVVIPPTTDQTPPPPVKKPGIPIPLPKEEIADDATITPTTGKEYHATDLPPEPLVYEAKFIRKEDRPKVIGGYAALMRNVKYPEIAQRAGIEGTVKVRAFIDKYGQVTDVLVLKGVPRSGLNEAAMEAVKKTKFRPAVQRDKNVGVWMEFAIVFRLK